MGVGRPLQPRPAVHHCPHQTLHLPLLAGHEGGEVLPGVLHRGQPLPSPQQLNKLQLVDAQLQPVVLPDRLSAARLGPGEEKRGVVQAQRLYNERKTKRDSSTTHLNVEVKQTPIGWTGSPAEQI